MYRKGGPPGCGEKLPRRRLRSFHAPAVPAPDLTPRPTMYVVLTPID
jgi:hypothetical protein